MKFQVAFVLLCTVFSKALSLKCYECVPNASLTCTQTQTECSTSQCVTSTNSIFVAGQKTDFSMKTCALAADSCVSGSMNLGIMKMYTNAQCCSTDLCNGQTPPAPSQQSPNGNTCYTCDDKGCSGVVRCEGSEDRCITASVQQGGNKISVKGCTSKDICNAAGSTAQPGLGISSLSCCQGNLCNSAERFTLSFFLMLLIPLLPSVLFY